MKLNALKLQLAMAKACITVSDLAKKAEISRSALNKYINQNVNPKPITIGMLAKALGCEVEDLIED